MKYNSAEPAAGQMAESVLIIDPQFKVTMAPVPVLAVLFRPARLQQFARMKAAQTLNLPATGGAEQRFHCGLDVAVMAPISNEECREILQPD
jgi:hypothetical protein